MVVWILSVDNTNEIGFKRRFKWDFRLFWLYHIPAVILSSHIISISIRLLSL